MEVNAGYKQTEVGIIPDGWEIKQLGDIAPISTGSTPPTHDLKNYGDEYLFVSPVDMGVNKYIKRTDKMLSKKGFAISRHFPQGSVLFVCIGSTIGKCGIASETLTSNQQINAILPLPNISSNFLYYAVVAAAPRVKSLAGEQAVPIVNKTQFSETQIAVPPTLAEQEAIAEALSDADALIEALEQLITKKRQIKQGAMQELLTGKRRLPEFEKKTIYKQTEIGIIPEDWQVMMLAKVCRMKSGESITGENIDQFSEYPCYGGNGLRGFTNRFTHDGKYALIGRQGALCGNVLGVSGKFFASEHAIVVTALEQTDIQWLTYVLEDMRLNQYSESSAQPGLSVSKILSLVLALPPAKAEQTAIAEILSDMDAEITTLEDKLAKARQVKQGMMSVLLTGRVRLV